MILVTQTSRVGGSMVLVIPVPVIKKMKLVEREALLIDYDTDKMKISRLIDNITKKDNIRQKGGKGE